MSLLAVLFGAMLTLAEDSPVAGRCPDGRLWTAPAPQQVQMLGLLNRVRADQARPPLTRSPMLERMALAHSADMACRNYFDHRNPERQKLQDRFTRVANGPVPDWRRLAEVIGTSVTARRQLDRWLDSRSHRRAVLEEEHDRVGVGFVRIAGSRYATYWTVEFLTEER